MVLKFRCLIYNTISQQLDFGVLQGKLLNLPLKMLLFAIFGAINGW